MVISNETHIDNKTKFLNRPRGPSFCSSCDNDNLFSQNVSKHLHLSPFTLIFDTLDEVKTILSYTSSFTCTL